MQFFAPNQFSITVHSLLTSLKNYKPAVLTHENADVLEFDPGILALLDYNEF
jgi:hypothetical protein